VDPQLEILLQIQDLKAQRHELEQGRSEREVQEAAFKMDVDTAIATLDTKITEVMDELSPRVRQRYERVAGNVERVVAPVIGGVCYGCFVAIPTSISSDAGERAKLRNCENCGRFLYFVG
jgi:predicted  nucleic acid-binding Zn-ribbon protein